MVFDTVWGMEVEFEIEVNGESPEVVFEAEKEVLEPVEKDRVVEFKAGDVTRTSG